MLPRPTEQQASLTRSVAASEQCALVEEIKVEEAPLLPEEELQARLDNLQDITISQIQELEEMIGQKLGKVIEMTNTLSNSCEQRFSWLEKKGLERQSVIDDIARDMEQLKTEVRAPHEELWAKERGEVFNKVSALQHDFAQVQSQLRSTQRQADDELQSKLDTSVAAIRQELEKAMATTQSQVGKDFEGLQEEFRSVVSDVNVVRKDFEHAQQAERRERLELARALDMHSTARNQEAFEDREKRSRLVSDLQQGMQTLQLRLTDMETDQSTTRVREVSETQIRFDNLKAEMDKLRADVEKSTTTIREIGRGKKEGDVPKDLAALRRVVHDLADVSRLQGEKLDELEKDVEFTRESQKSIGRNLSITNGTDADIVQRCKTEMIEHQSRMEKEMSELRHHIEANKRSASITSCSDIVPTISVRAPTDSRMRLDSFSDSRVEPPPQAQQRSSSFCNGDGRNSDARARLEQSQARLDSFASSERRLIEPPMVRLTTASPRPSDAGLGSASILMSEKSFLNGDKSLLNSERSLLNMDKGMFVGEKVDVGEKGPPLTPNANSPRTSFSSDMKLGPLALVPPPSPKTTHASEMNLLPSSYSPACHSPFETRQTA